MASCQGLSGLVVPTAPASYASLDTEKGAFQAYMSPWKSQFSLQRKVSDINWRHFPWFSVVLVTYVSWLVHTSDAAVGVDAELPTTSSHFSPSGLPALTRVLQHTDVQLPKSSRTSARKIRSFALKRPNASFEKRPQDTVEALGESGNRSELCWTFVWMAILRSLLRLIPETFHAVAELIYKRPALWLRVCWVILNFTFAISATIECMKFPVDSLAEMQSENYSHCARCCACHSRAYHTHKQTEELPLLPCEKPILWPAVRFAKCATALQRKTWQTIYQILGRCTTSVVSECCCSCSFSMPSTLKSIEDYFSAQPPIDNGSEDGVISLQASAQVPCPRYFVAPGQALVSFESKTEGQGMRDLKDDSGIATVKRSANDFKICLARMEETKAALEEREATDALTALMATYRGQRGLHMWALLFSVSSVYALQATIFAWQGKPIAANLLIGASLAGSDGSAPIVENTVPSFSTFGVQGSIFLLIEFMLSVCLVERLFAAVQSLSIQRKRGICSYVSGSRLACAMSLLTVCFLGGLAAAQDRGYVFPGEAHPITTISPLKAELLGQSSGVRNSNVELVFSEQSGQNDTGGILQRNGMHRRGQQQTEERRINVEKLKPNEETGNYVLKVRDSARVSGEGTNYNNGEWISALLGMAFLAWSALWKQLVRGSVLVPFLVLRVIAIVLLITLVGNKDALLQQRDSTRPHELHWLVWGVSISSFGALPLFAWGALSCGNCITFAGVDTILALQEVSLLFLYIYIRRNCFQISSKELYTSVNDINSAFDL